MWVMGFGESRNIQLPAHITCELQVKIYIGKEFCIVQVLDRSLNLKDLSCLLKMHKAWDPEMTLRITAQ